MYKKAINFEIYFVKTAQAESFKGNKTKYLVLFTFLL